MWISRFVASYCFLYRITLIFVALKKLFFIDIITVKIISKNSRITVLLN